MSETNVEIDSQDANDGKRTMLGVGIASLMRPQSQTAPYRTLAPAAHEPSIEVSGEITSEESTTSPEETLKVTRERLFAHTPRAQDGDDAALMHPIPTPRRRWIGPVLLAVGALGVSIGIGLGARRTISSTPEHARTPLAPVAAPAQAAAVHTEAPALGTLAATPAAPVEPAFAPIKAAAVVAGEGALPPAQNPIEPAAPRVVDLGDGSCSAFVDSTSMGEVWVDDQPVGSTPVTVSGLWCGRRMNIRVNRRGFDGWSKTVVTQEGRESRIIASLRRVPPPTEIAPSSPRKPIRGAEARDPFVGGRAAVNDPFYFFPSLAELARTGAANTTSAHAPIKAASGPRGH